ncbi:NADH:flavin oxidoreductase/NADH oxidase [Rugamonas sp.]|uniref:NADH:flavin oxidoreductase/NADH oxidase n=1 Tax=Rugamonas sp. TaxID=1926287 RepID=UPI0025F4AC6C|nr:NADH:flavin oxidoreductase/NADH oxidase [Rugamonas sp.]
MSALFSPHQLGKLTLPNRIVVSPMCQYWAVDGQPTPWHTIHLGSMAASGAGALFIEATAVEPGGRITPGDLGLWDERTESALIPVLSAVRQFSPIRVIMQLSHAGRKASSHVPWEGGQQILPADGGWPTDAPSALPQMAGEAPPRALDRVGMIRIRNAFVAAAQRAVRLGVDGLELHAAHGYLLHQVLSPIANERGDDYGGSLENRMRFPLEVYDAVRAVLPAAMPLGVKVSATDWIDGGWDLEQTIAFAKVLKARGVDWIDASSGGISPRQKITIGAGYQVPFAQAIKEATGVTTIAVGLITQAQQAEDIIAAGHADFVALARAMLYNPRWPWHAAAELGATVTAAPPYWRAAPREYPNLISGTSFGAR